MDGMVVMHDKKRIVTLLAVIIALLMVGAVVVISIHLSSGSSTTQETADTRSLIDRAEDAQKRGDVTEALSFFNKALEEAKRTGNKESQVELEVRIDYLVTSPDSEGNKKPTLPEVKPVTPSDTQTILN